MSGPGFETQPGDPPPGHSGFSACAGLLGGLLRVWSAGLGWGQRLCLSDKLPGDADGLTLQGPHLPQK